MARVAGSYQSVTRGVSQQVPHDRRPGQHWEQDNMLSDPVRGTTRRHGSLKQDEVIYANCTEAQHAVVATDALGFKEFTFFNAGVEYALIYRGKAKYSSSVAPLCWAYNKDSSVFLPVNRPASDSVVDALTSGGVSSIVAVGKFLYIAGNTVTPTYSTNNAWADTTNARRTSVWIRGGTYSRTFTVKCSMSNGTTKTFSYTTPSSAYQGTLDTSDILYTATDYQKQVNDRTNAYNTAVTQWLATASAAIQPQSIAANLLTAAAGQGLSGSRIGSHIVFDHTQDIVEIEVSDGGDNTFIRGVAADVASPDLLTNVHYAGKVVRVLPKKNNEEDAYYLKAIPKVDGAPGWVEVTWREAAGVEYTPTSVFAFATVKNGQFYIAGSASALGTLIGETVPGFEKNQVGDAVSSTVPTFFGKKIDYLGLYQDRLIVGSGSVLMFSRPGDYLNWFRTSVLTIDDRDPVEMFAIGAEDDTIVCSTTYDRNLVLFGKRKQYALDGRINLTPLNASITIMSAHEDATEAFPVNSGNLVFFGKRKNSFSSVHQIQIGQVAESPEAYEISQQLDTYLTGAPLEIRATTAPNIVAFRSTGLSNGLYIYSYLDVAGGGERLFDSWSRWVWDTSLGSIVGVSTHNSDILVFTTRQGKDRDGVDKAWIVADKFSTEGALSDKPYLDSMRTYSAYSSPVANAWLQSNAVLTNVSAAYDFTKTEYMLGAPIERASTELVPEYGSSGLWVGVENTAYFVPTNPFLRDRQDKAILSGRLTLVSVLVSLADTGGFEAYVANKAGEKRVLRFTGRVAGSTGAIIGKQPIVTRSEQFIVGYETRECQYKIKALTWLPLTVDSIEWKGQVFNNSRRG